MLLIYDIAYFLPVPPRFLCHSRTGNPLCRLVPPSPRVGHVYSSALRCSVFFAPPLSGYFSCPATAPVPRHGTGYCSSEVCSCVSPPSSPCHHVEISCRSAPRFLLDPVCFYAHFATLGLCTVPPRGLSRFVPVPLYCRLHATMLELCCRSGPSRYCAILCYSG